MHEPVIVAIHYEDQVGPLQVMQIKASGTMRCEIHVEGLRDALEALLDLPACSRMEARGSYFEYVRFRVRGLKAGFYERAPEDITVTDDQYPAYWTSTQQCGGDRPGPQPCQGIVSPFDEFT